MSDPFFIIPGLIYLALICLLIYVLILAIKFMKKGIKAFDSITKYLVGFMKSIIHESKVDFT